MYPISIDYAHFSHCLQYRLRDGGACTADESVWVGHGMGGGDRNEFDNTTAIT